MKEKITIYQVLPRLYGNACTKNVPNGTLKQNGCGKMADFTDAELARIRAFGFSHIWYTGLLEHATQTDYSSIGIAKDHPAVVKGRAGSPYAIKDYYDIDPDLAVAPEKRMKEFEALVRRTHKAGLKMVIDFVPNHVARQYHSDAKPARVKDLGEADDMTMGFSAQNNFYYLPGQPLSTKNFDHAQAARSPYKEYPARATGNDQFTAEPGEYDWYETVKLNYGVDYCGGCATHFDPVPDTWKKMTAILLFWAKKGVDAFRCDMAEMVPAAFWNYAISEVKKKHPAMIFIAEVYNPGEYRNYIRSGFDYLYDKVGLYDTLRAVVCGHASARAITGAWQAVDDIREHMLYFLENHDEQRIASVQFAGNPITARPALVAAACMGSNPLMIYAGQELGEPAADAEGFSGADGRTTIFDYWGVPSLQKLQQGEMFFTPEEAELYNYYRRVLTAVTTDEALREGMFYDLMYVNYDAQCGFNPDRHYAFLRTTGKETVLVCCNFTDAEATVGIRIPAHAFTFLSMKSGVVSACDLLSGETQTIELKPDAHTTVSVPAHSAVMLRW